MKLLLFAAMIATVALPVVAGSPYMPTDAERARWTMADMNSWHLALAAYKLDHKRYPPASSIEQLRSAIEGSYMIKAPLTDVWGHAYRYSYDASSDDYMLISAGADGVFQNEKDLSPGKAPTFDDDAVAKGSAKFLFRSWDYR